jgi:hypothetical protein
LSRILASDDCAPNLAVTASAIAIGRRIEEQALEFQRDDLTLRRGTKIATS